MNDIPQQNPDKASFITKMEESIKIDEIAKLLKLNKKQKYMFKHAAYYLNTLYADFADIQDIGHIYLSILRIENEEIPNVPILDAGMELPTGMLRQRAALLLMQGLIIGLDSYEVDLLKNTLSLLLKKEELESAYAVVEKLERSPSDEVSFPVEPDTLRKYWKLNQRRLLAS